MTCFMRALGWMQLPDVRTLVLSHFSVTRPTSRGQHRSPQTHYTALDLSQQRPAPPSFKPDPSWAASMWGDVQTCQSQRSIENDLQSTVHPVQSTPPESLHPPPDLQLPVAKLPCPSVPLRHQQLSTAGCSFKHEYCDQTRLLPAQHSLTASNIEWTLDLS